MRDASLRRTLATTTMASLGTALLLASGAFVAYELITFRGTMVRTLSTQAEIVARQSVSALVFRDPESAKATLSALSAEPHVVSAAIFDRGGTLFSSYARDATGEAVPPRPPLAGAGHFFAHDRLVLSRPIAFDNAPIGTVVIESDLDEMKARLQRYAAIVVAVLIVSFALAYGTAARLQRAFTDPVLHLAATAQAVSDRRDYTVRAVTNARGELGLLVRTFNDMLNQIQDRDAALQRARDDLEGQVVDRTRTLQGEIAERKLLEEQLRTKNTDLEDQSRRVQEATRLKSEFLANMSHELRTPLNAIIGFAELMHDGKVGAVSPPHKECLADILTSSRHLLQLINDVLDLSKVEAGKMEFRPERVEVAKLIGEVKDILRSLSAKKHIELAVEIDPALDEVVLDPGKLKQVLYNYLSNALKFTPEGGRVTVRARLEGAGRFRLEVADTGVGIRPEDLGRLFVEFQQLDASASKAHAGTGLGLALTKRIVEAQEGTVGVSSVVGQGSIFHAVLPRLARSASVETAATPARRAGGRATLLVVEDDAKERAWLAETLSSTGYAVEVATTGKEAIEKSAARAYDGITLDLLLPDMGGWDVLKAIRAGGPNRATPVVVVTVVVEKGVGAGYAIHDYLAKPVRAEELVASLLDAGLRPNAARPVLVVDDDPQARRLMVTTLLALGYSSIEAASAQQGLALAAQETPAAVILDLAMPGMDGFAFLEHFRAMPAGRGTPVIVWTVKDLTAADHARLAASAQAVVLKGGTARLLEELRTHVPLRSDVDRPGQAADGS
ncbi:MAG TPA: response regulator [Vicinamibacteria bacterium]|nr:response regulator [Vicinamibacteria bacterium]